MKSHIINGHYMFGNTFVQPDMPYYNHFKHHIMAPINRPMPPYPDINGKPGGSCNIALGKCLCFETENGNKVDCPYINPDETSDGTKCQNCDLCKPGIIRDPLAYSVVNIETSIVKTLKITLYGASANTDKTVEMKVGGRYSITYITEQGLVTSVGYLELISDSVPDKCTRYVGGTNNMATASTAYIGMDCSTEGHSDKRKIYIASIRYIQILEDGEIVDSIEVKSLRDRLQELLDAIEKGELVFCNKDCGHGDTANPEIPPTTNSDETDPDTPPVIDPEVPDTGDNTENPDNETNPDKKTDGELNIGETSENKDSNENEQQIAITTIGYKNDDAKVISTAEEKLQELLDAIENGELVWKDNASNNSKSEQETEYTTPYKASTAFIPTPDMVLDDTKNVVRMDAKLLGI